MQREQPFLGQQAVCAGELTEHRLRTGYRALYRNVYLETGADPTAAQRAVAAWRWADGNCVLVGPSAAAVHGTKWLAPDWPAEIARVNRHSPAGIVVRSYQLHPDQICAVDGMAVTTPDRTAFDLGRLLPAARAVPVIDALMRATGTLPDAVLALADAAAPGTRGVRVLRRTLDLCDPGAESPQESRLRMVLMCNGIPRPDTQIEFFNDYGEAFIRVDMGWPQWKVAVEYDGIQHWDDARQRAWDIERIAYLESLGWTVIRVSARMLARPEALLARVMRHLRAAGCPL